MHRLCVVAALALAACGTSVDDRPATLEYVTQAILAPSCGNAQCHSSFRRVEDYAFDTVEEARDSINTYALVVPFDVEGSLLHQVLVTEGGNPDDGALQRMPYDQPMSDRDVDLIDRWIEKGAPGL